jgi:hypothetical protein
MSTRGCPPSRSGSTVGTQIQSLATHSANLLGSARRATNSGNQIRTSTLCPATNFVPTSSNVAHRPQHLNDNHESTSGSTRENQHFVVNSNVSHIQGNSVRTFETSQYMEGSNLGVVGQESLHTGSSSSATPSAVSSITPGDSVSNLSSSGTGEVEKMILEASKGICERICLFETPFKEGYNSSTSVETYIWREAAAACQQDSIGPPSKSAKLELRKHMTAARSRLVYQCKLLTIKKFKDMSKEDIIQEVDYLMDKDRYVCHPDGAQNYNKRFLNPMLIEIIYDQFFRGPKMKGRTDPTFIEQINSVLICLTATAMHHQLEAYINGVYEPLQQFREKTVGRHFQRHTASWIGLGEELQELHIAFYKSEIRKMMRRSGHIEREIPVEGYEETDISGSISFLRNQLEANEQEAVLTAMQRRNRQRRLPRSTNENTREAEIEQENARDREVEQRTARDREDAQETAHDRAVEEEEVEEETL